MHDTPVECGHYKFFISFDMCLRIQISFCLSYYLEFALILV